MYVKSIDYSRKLHNPSYGKLGWMVRFKKFHQALVFVVMMMTLAASGLPVYAAPSSAKFMPGTYSGIFFFSFTHTFNTPPSEAILMNYYSLESGYGIAKGHIKFSVGTDGAPQNIRVKINPFYYNIAASLEIKAEEGCKGYNASGVGLGWASVSAMTSGPPKLVPTTFRSGDIKLKSGGVLGFAEPIGDCEGNPPADTFVNSIRADIDSLPASPWEFNATVIQKQWAAGTCTTASWTTADRTFTCFWQVFKK